jgi:hypothetical protein
MNPGAHDNKMATSAGQYPPCNIKTLSCHTPADGTVDDIGEFSSVSRRGGAPPGPEIRRASEAANFESPGKTSPLPSSPRMTHLQLAHLSHQTRPLSTGARFTTMRAEISTRRSGRSGALWRRASSPTRMRRNWTHVSESAKQRPGRGRQDSARSPRRSAEPSRSWRSDGFIAGRAGCPTGRSLGNGRACSAARRRCPHRSGAATQSASAPR